MGGQPNPMLLALHGLPAPPGMPNPMALSMAGGHMWRVPCPHCRPLLPPPCVLHCFLLCVLPACPRRPAPGTKASGLHPPIRMACTLRALQAASLSWASPARCPSRQA